MAKEIRAQYLEKSDYFHFVILVSLNMEQECIAYYLYFKCH